MLEKSFGLLYFLKQPKTKESTNYYVYLRITVNGLSRVISTKRYWSIDRWSQSNGRAVGTKKDAKSLNTYLEILAAKVYQAKLSLIESNKNITAESLKNKINVQDDKAKTLLELFEIHNKKIESLIGNGFSVATLKRYRTIFLHTRNFIKLKYDASDLSIHDLNYEFVSDYAYWLAAFKSCGNNSVAKYVGNLKGIVVNAVKKGWLKSDPFVDFKTTKMKL
jgi:hypothetical protein